LPAKAGDPVKVTLIDPVKAECVPVIVPPTESGKEGEGVKPLIPLTFEICIPGKSVVIFTVLELQLNPVAAPITPSELFRL
jgi:hypothetical protein